MASKTSAGDPGIQKSWLNLIMHLTAIIAERKQDIGSAHLLRTIVDVFVIIFLEGVLAIVSIPIYFETNKGHYSKENEFYIQYRVRKFLTFLLLFLISAVFVLKLCLTLWITFSAPEINQGNVSKPETSSAGVEVINVENNNFIQAPSIDGSGQGGTLVSGRAANKGSVIVFVSPVNERNAKEMLIFRAEVDPAGNWSVADSGMVRSGTYSVTAVNIDSSGTFRSAGSKPFIMTVQPAAPEMINEILDKLMGFLVLSFIGIGLIVLILTI